MPCRIVCNSLTGFYAQPARRPGLIHDQITLNTTAMNNERRGNQISVLNSLVEINNDRIEGYLTAFEETDDPDLKRLFQAFSHTSWECKEELESEILRLGGTPDQETRASGKLFRVWMDFKAAMTGKDRKGILNSCEQGEDVAVGVMKKYYMRNL